MKLLFAVPFLAVQLVSFVSGQSLANIPQCAQSAAISSLVTTGCAITNYTCFCDDKSWISSLLPVVMSDCDAADFQSTVQFAQQLCESAGVTLSISGVSAPASTNAATGTAVSSSSTSVAMVSSMSSGSPVMSSSSGAASMTTASATASMTSASATAMATPSASSASSPATASWVTLGRAVSSVFGSVVFIFFGNLV
ncbi:hypothetical protein MMC15_005877 [Xylographa vitiligo]|nr:hypothetical protein [Xylographa vitiligo]